MLVFPGYLELPLLSALLWGRRHRVKMILGFESTVLDKPRYQLLEWIKFKLVNSFHRAFVNGERSRSYLNSLGFHNNDIVTVSQTVDNDFFIKESGLVRAERARWRAMLNLPDHYFLYVGRLESAKNVVGLVETYGLLCRQNRDNGFGLVIVGNGPEETRIRKLVKQQRLYNVHLVGFKPMEQLAPYYALADCFVIASICDPGPMVVHEAMACGLPILISERCGSVAELVKPGINGFQFNPEDHEVLAGLMAGIASGQADLKRMGQASSERIRDFTPERYAERLAQALEL
jgi:glycosyltransferase involved in cell wall biosynthesis